MKKLAFILVLYVFVACNSSTIEVSSVNDVSQIDFTKQDVVLLDVRSAEEFNEGHIFNAINVDFNAANFESEIEKLDPNKTYYVYCKSGVRSTKACRILETKGFDKIVNLSDGYKNYKGN